MQRVSSNLTLMFKIFLPVFWLVFFGVFAIASFFVKDAYLAGYPVIYFRAIAVGFFFCGLLFFWYTMMRLKRVELSGDHVFITNYFKHIRYTWDSINYIEEKDYYFFKTMIIHLKDKGIFGKKMAFLASPGRMQSFLNDHPRIAQYLSDNTPAA